ncbi:HipA domain-containing protein [Mesorhizobium escarrei]|uniref:Non-specific serine/threonine protein kinase n=1 Tax=Mesorhizobium escarrei TaxID=666018 RepID=A0ABN8JN00_9HYPH|nr:putative Non-specific serine/threonine protein kinase [Mesorhizobium escarrei]
MSPALVVERFDVRRGPTDRRYLALEDFCSVLDLPASAKYDGTIERMARGLRPLSTDPAADIETLFRRAFFAWLIADGDMHLKNLALLKIAESGSKRFDTVRFAPLYDAVTTRVFPGLGGDRMALKLNGKDDRLTRQDFLTLARTIELPVARAEEATVRSPLPCARQCLRWLCRRFSNGLMLLKQRRSE